jgi:hypothetical protein
MKLTNEELWNNQKTINDDPYGAAIIKFAEKWADLMEAATPEGKPLTQEIMNSTEHQADKGIGITGFQYGAAVATLSECWYRGEELRILHNAEYGVEATEEGVVNPAILTISES